MNRILIVEDDRTIARLVACELENWGYEVALAEDFAAVMETFDRFCPGLVLLDLSLPVRSGFHWCGEIRKKSSVPIIFISSAANNMNMVTALHKGADDFIAKPFDLPVLVAKVQALLRRSYEFSGPVQRLECRGAVLDVDGMALVYGAGRIELSRNEFRILKTLMENKNRVVSRGDIMRQLWEDEHFIDDNTLTVNVNRLRKRLEAAGLEGLIVTKKGEGYLAGDGE